MSYLFRWIHRGGPHVHVVVFAGDDAEHRARSGELTFRVDEWRAFRRMLERRTTTDHVQFEERP
jgi:hypothetical protein